MAALRPGDGDSEWERVEKDLELEEESRLTAWTQNIDWPIRRKDVSLENLADCDDEAFADFPLPPPVPEFTTNASGEEEGRELKTLKEAIREQKFDTARKRTNHSKNSSGEAYAQITAFFRQQLNDLGYGVMDLGIGLSILGVFHRQHKAERRRGLSCERDIFEAGEHFLHFASAAYGREWFERYLLGGPKDKEGNVLGVSPASKSAVPAPVPKIELKDIIRWQFTAPEMFRPCYFLAMDHTSQSIVLSIRGTWSLQDIVTDLACEYIPWMGGTAHKGIAQTAEWFKDHFEEILSDLRKRWPSYSIKLVGHSLGAGVAAAVTILLLADDPTLPVSCFAYSPPGVCSQDILDKYKANEHIVSFVLEDDVVPRVSWGAIADLKIHLSRILAQSGGGFGKIFRLLAVGKRFGPEWTQGISKWLDITPYLEPGDIFLAHHERNERIFLPGRVFHLYEDPLYNAPGYFLAEEIKASELTDILVSDGMLADHGVESYFTALRSILAWGRLT